MCFCSYLTFERAQQGYFLRSCILVKGSTIDDLGLGARRKNRKWIYFFRGNAFFLGESLLRFIFSCRRASEIYFFSNSSGPSPRSLMVVP